MTIKEVKNQLDKLGYFTYFASGDLVIGKRKADDSEIGGILLDNFCLLMFDGNKITIEYGQTNLPEEKQVSNITDAVTFILKEFPI